MYSPLEQFFIFVVYPLNVWLFDLSITSVSLTFIFIVVNFCFLVFTFISIFNFKLMKKISHPFHLVNSSPWPFLMGIAAVNTAIALVSYMHQFESSFICIFFVFINTFLVLFYFSKNKIVFSYFFVFFCFFLFFFVFFCEPVFAEEFAENSENYSKYSLTNKKIQGSFYFVFYASLVVWFFCSTKGSVSPSVVTASVGDTGPSSPSVNAVESVIEAFPALFNASPEIVSNATTSAEVVSEAISEVVSNTASSNATTSAEVVSEAISEVVSNTASSNATTSAEVVSEAISEVVSNTASSPYFPGMLKHIYASTGVELADSTLMPMASLGGAASGLISTLFSNTVSSADSSASVVQLPIKEGKQEVEVDTAPEIPAQLNDYQGIDFANPFDREEVGADRFLSEFFQNYVNGEFVHVIVSGISYIIPDQLLVMTVATFWGLLTLVYRSSEFFFLEDLPFLVDGSWVSSLFSFVQEIRLPPAFYSPVLSQLMLLYSDPVFNPYPFYDLVRGNFMAGSQTLRTFCVQPISLFHSFTSILRKIAEILDKILQKAELSGHTVHPSYQIFNGYLADLRTILNATERLERLINALLRYLVMQFEDDFDQLPAPSRVFKKKKLF